MDNFDTLNIIFCFADLKTIIQSAPLVCKFWNSVYKQGQFFKIVLQNLFPNQEIKLDKQECKWWLERKIMCSLPYNEDIPLPNAQFHKSTIFADIHLKWSVGIFDLQNGDKFLCELKRLTRDRIFLKSASREVPGYHQKSTSSEYYLLDLCKGIYHLTFIQEWHPTWHCAQNDSCGMKYCKRKIHPGKETKLLESGIFWWGASCDPGRMERFIYDDLALPKLDFQYSKLPTLIRVCFSTFDHNN